jgi:hypothetical protein
MSTDLITEADFAERLGLQRDVLEEVRAHALTEGQDWLTERRRVCYTPSGVEKALEALQAPKKEAAAALEKTPERAVFYVAKIPLNTRVLLATADKERKGPRVTIRVRDSRLFTIGLAIAATPTDGASWNFVGKHPRKKGDRPRL